MKRSVADRIQERLEEFTLALERGDEIQSKFTCRKVEFRVDPQPCDPREGRENLEFPDARDRD